MYAVYCIHRIFRRPSKVEQNCNRGQSCCVCSCLVAIPLQGRQETSGKAGGTLVVLSANKLKGENPKANVHTTRAYNLDGPTIIQHQTPLFSNDCLPSSEKSNHFIPALEKAIATVDSYWLTKYIHINGNHMKTSPVLDTMQFQDPILPHPKRCLKEGRDSHRCQSLKSLGARTHPLLGKVHRRAST